MELFSWYVACSKHAVKKLAMINLNIEQKALGIHCKLSSIKPKSLDWFQCWFSTTQYGKRKNLDSIILENLIEISSTKHPSKN